MNQKVRNFLLVLVGTCTFAIIPMVNRLWVDTNPDTRMVLASWDTSAIANCEYSDDQGNVVHGCRPHSVFQQAIITETHAIQLNAIYVYADEYMTQVSREDALRVKWEAVYQGSK